MPLTDIQRQILDTVKNSSGRLTVTDILDMLATGATGRKTIRNSLKMLVESGELTYSCSHGHTFVEQSFFRPVRLSRHVLVVPEGYSVFPEADDIAVIIRHGAAFGTGQHPSTRLAVQALDHLLLDQKMMIHIPTSKMLDIGTGSGILAIASLKMGIHQAVCLDIDPCARFETLENARINRVQNQLEVVDSELADIAPMFHLITANLRYPTLHNMIRDIDRLTQPESCVVVAGIKRDECEPLKQKYQTASFQPVWIETDGDWAGMILQKES